MMSKTLRSQTNGIPTFGFLQAYFSKELGAPFLTGRPDENRPERAAGNCWTLGPRLWSLGVSGHRFSRGAPVRTDARELLETAGLLGLSSGISVYLGTVSQEAPQ